jgi:phage baseplate assembly protein gpV
MTTYLPPFERTQPDRAHGPRWSETAMGEVVAVGTGNRNGLVQVELYSYDGAQNQDGPIWARVVVPVAGRQRGSFLIPEVGNEVLIAFVGGDSRMPVVLGSMWNGRDAPPEELPDAKIDRWSFTSPTGTKISVTETSAADSKVTIELPDKVTAVFSAEGTGKIELNAGGSSMVMDAQGIRFETSGEFCATSATACHSASMVEFDAPLSSFSGVTQCTTSQADTVVSTVYTPGAGNIW